MYRNFQWNPCLWWHLFAGSSSIHFNFAPLGDWNLASLWSRRGLWLMLHVNYMSTTCQLHVTTCHYMSLHVTSLSDLSIFHYSGSQKEPLPLQTTWWVICDEDTAASTPKRTWTGWVLHISCILSGKAPQSRLLQRRMAVLKHWHPQIYLLRGSEILETQDLKMGLKVSHIQPQSVFRPNLGKTKTTPLVFHPPEHVSLCEAGHRQGGHQILVSFDQVFSQQPLWKVWHKVSLFWWSLMDFADIHWKINESYWKLMVNLTVSPRLLRIICRQNGSFFGMFDSKHFGGSWTVTLMGPAAAAKIVLIWNAHRHLVLQNNFEATKTRTCWSATFNNI